MPPSSRKRRLLKGKGGKGRKDKNAKKATRSSKRKGGDAEPAQPKKGKATPAEEDNDVWDDWGEWEAEAYCEWGDEGEWAAWYGEEWAAWDKDSGVAATPAGRKPKAKAVPKATANAKAKAKAKAAPKSSPKAKAKAKTKNAADSHPKKSLKETKGSKSYDNIDEYQVDQAKQAIMAYAEKYVGMKYKPALKKGLRSDAGPRPTNSGLNIYWTKCGCGVSCKTVSKDTGYFYFRGQGVSYLLRLCVAIKAAYLLVVHPHFRRHVIELEVCRVG